ncbi:cytochrome b [Roseibium polysiphoniae]|uniref:Cytochrome b n=1 Tax=Roseibium polysiphoniae TaxID=2571221 RepID=A0ABR9CEX4_9HYPH|nr:cytochrome b [Roseibium polysiphoniae]MBD8878429.1 cytochrome b [Roseibium polysiphoniae]
MARSDTRYSALARLFHWLTVVLVLTMVPAGIVMIRIDGGSLQNTLFDYHRSVGFVLLVLTLVRLVFRFGSHPAPLPEAIPLWQRMAARATHAFLYIFLILNPLVGWVATSAYGAAIEVFGLFTLPALVAKDRALADQLFPIHEVLGLAFVAVVTVHIGAALFHGLIKRDGVLQRML